ncbi:MAG: EAL domain-containing protein [Acidobacteriota bacterium]|nr:MAG: EAL domain-containing protein [Acidobacteriota bacterium]
MTLSSKTDRYMATVIVAGALCVLISILNFDISRVDIYLVLLSVFAILVGSRITLRIPKFKSHISVSDTFVFLALLLYGGEYATILAAVEAAASSWRFCNRKLTVFFNAAAMAVSTSAVVVVLKVSGFYEAVLSQGSANVSRDFIIGLSLIALVQFLANTLLASAYDVLKDAASLAETWKSKYLWSYITYFVGAGSAGIMVQMAGYMGLGTMLAVFPVIGFIFYTYRMYLKNVEISVQQAEQAEQYAKILESQSNALRESEDRFRSAFDHAPIGIALVSPLGKWLKVNRALTDILGYSEEEFLATDFQSLTLPEDLGNSLIKVHELLSGRISNCQMEQRYVHSSGKVVWASWSASAAADENAAQPNLIFQIQDITEKKAVEEKLQHDATHDALTGLPNRALFMSQLGAALEKSRQIVGYRVCVLFIDLDRFKYVNDSLGHLIGDELLREISRRLRDCLRPSDMVARLGGDEFTILVEGKYDTSEVTNIADRIQKKFGIPFDLSGHEVYSSASIGILHASGSHYLPEDVMRDADTAMYQAKRSGKARHETFDEQMHKAAKETLKLETDLRRALERREIDIHYQPIYSLNEGSVTCLETLARWTHPEFGPIPANRFIALAEEIGLIDKLCEQMLEKACSEIGNLNSAADLSISLNLSCRQFAKTDLIESIDSILANAGFSHRRLKLEITESVLFEHQERAVSMLNELNGRGVDINIDDFGTGYSNLGYLTQLPVSAIKIDRSFVSMIDREGNNDDLVKAIITLARNLRLDVIAEGVEYEGQLEVLTKHGCEYAQGFYFAPPMDITMLASFLGEPMSSPVDTVGGLNIHPVVQ